MSQVQLLAQCLQAAGYTLSTQGDGLYLLYVDPEKSSLISKFWVSDKFTDQELIAASVRPNSSASYLTTSTGKLAVCISPSSTLRIIRYDEDEEDWVEDDTIGQLAVHPDSKVAAAVSVDQKTHVLFQDPSMRLVYLDAAWTATVLPAEPVVGTPLATIVIDSGVNVFYISAVDNRLHCVSQGPGNSWNDAACGQYTFEATPKQIYLTAKQGGQGGLEVYVMSEKNEVQQIAAGQAKILGKVDEVGKFVPLTTEECCFCFSFSTTVVVSWGYGCSWWC
jgi:hypothetical protein